MKQLIKLLTSISFMVTVLPFYQACAETVELNLILFTNPTSQVHEQFSAVYPKFPRLDYQDLAVLPECDSQLKLEALSEKLSDNQYEILFKRCVIIEDQSPHLKFKLSNLNDAEMQQTPSNIFEALNHMHSTNMPFVLGAIDIFRNNSLDVSLDLVYTKPSSIDGPRALGRLKSKRKVHLKEINYFDHPLFGALIFVSSPKATT